MSIKSSAGPFWKSKNKTRRASCRVMKSFPVCLNRLRSCVWVGLGSVGGRGEKDSCRVSVCLIFLSHCSLYRLLLFNCRWGAPQFLCVLGIFSHLISYLPTRTSRTIAISFFERGIPLEMTEVFFFYLRRKQELRLTSPHRRI